MTTPQTADLRIVEADAISSAPIGPARPMLALVPTREELDDLERYTAARRAPNTTRAYASQWKSFTAFCAERQAVALPAAPITVAVYLRNRIAAGLSNSTITQAVASIAAAHREANEADPTADERVRAVRAGMSRTHSRTQQQAAPLDEDAFRAIRQQITEAAAAAQARAAARPGNRREQQRSANIERRSAEDIALIAVMRDALLRRSEAAALNWADIAAAPDGTGTLYIARSKTDQEAEGRTQHLRRPTMRYLSAIRPEDAADDAPVFDLSESQISRRIKQAAQAAGLAPDVDPADPKDRDNPFSSHSARVGMAIDLTRRDAPLQELQAAGRWESPTMPGRYAQLAGLNAVARRMPAED